MGKTVGLTLPGCGQPDGHVHGDNLRSIHLGDEAGGGLGHGGAERFVLFEDHTDPARSACINPEDGHRPSLPEGEALRLRPACPRQCAGR